MVWQGPWLKLTLKNNEANLLALRMILPSWFANLVISSNFLWRSSVQIVKTSCPSAGYVK